MERKKVLKILALQIPILLFYGIVSLSIYLGIPRPEIIKYSYYLIIFILFVLIKASVFKIIFEKIKNWKNLYKTIIVNSIISLIIGIVIFSISTISSAFASYKFALCYSKSNYGNLDILFVLMISSVLINSVLYFIITYYLEYFTSLKMLKEDYESEKIQKTVLWYNFTNFLIPQICLVICTMFIIIFIPFDKGYAKCGVYPLMCYLLGIIIPAVLIGIGVFVIKKYIKKEERMGTLIFTKI